MNKKYLVMYNQYVSSNAYQLKYAHRVEYVRGLFKGFISSLYFMDIICATEFHVMRAETEALIKSIIRHYKKIGEWRKILY